MYIQRTFMVPLRDGIHLATDLYLPDTSGRWPLILFRTPYGRQYLPENPLYGSIDLSLIHISTPLYPALYCQQIL